MLNPYRVEIDGNESPALRKILEALDHLSRQLYLLHKTVSEIEPSEPVHFETTCTFEGCERPKLDSEHAFCVEHHNAIVADVQASMKARAEDPDSELSPSEAPAETCKACHATLTNAKCPNGCPQFLQEANL